MGERKGMVIRVVKETIVLGGRERPSCVVM